MPLDHLFQGIAQNVAFPARRSGRKRQCCILDFCKKATVRAPIKIMLTEPMTISRILLNSSLATFFRILRSNFSSVTMAGKP